MDVHRKRVCIIGSPGSRINKQRLKVRRLEFFIAVNGHVVDTIRNTFLFFR